MLWMCAIRLGLTPIECKQKSNEINYLLIFITLFLKWIKAIIKVDDSANGVTEGLLAGCWAVGIAKTSVYIHIINEFVV